MLPLPGQVVDRRYRVVSTLGEGGMGHVFLAEHVGTGAHVALKWLRGSRLASERARRSFELEARNAAVLRHTNTVRVFDYGVEDGQPYLVMEHLPGRSLAEEIRRCGPFGWRRAVHIASQVLKALWEAHEHPRGIVHRDIKPSNILLIDQPGDPDVVKVLDFGIARAMRTADHAETVDQMGSPQTMAPEQWESRPVGPQTDLYALGCVTYHMLAGRPPFQAESIAALGVMHLTKRPAPLTSLVSPDAPAALVDWVDRLMRKDPLRRPASARAALEALRVAVDSDGTVAALPDGEAVPPGGVGGVAPDDATLQMDEGRGPVEWMTLPEVTPARPLLTNLQPAYSSFIGREGELAALSRLAVDGTRLITVHGPPGTGKTRLAREWGLRAASGYPGGVWFCDLADAVTREGLCALVGAALEVPLVQRDPVAQLGEALRGRGQTLLILDTFERLVELAQDTVGAWLRVAREARFLVTSRERLGLRGERLLPLEPLPVPGEAASDVEELSQSQAVALFVDRARVLDDSFALDADNAADVAQLVRQLDGMPLAIELAAARVRLMSPKRMRARLSKRFELLRTGRRDASDRQATLAATLDWSWALLDGPERATLGQCSVFRGGFGLEAAEAVVDLAEWPGTWVLDALESLCDKSLLRIEPGEREEPRFNLFATIQDYAARKLAAPASITLDGDETVDDSLPAAVRQRHAEYFARLGDPAFLEHLGRDRAVAKTLDLELENLWLALNTAIETGDSPLAARLWPPVHEALIQRGPFTLAVTAGERLLAMPNLEPDPRSAILVRFSWLTAQVGRRDEAKRAIAEAEALWEALSPARRPVVRSARADQCWRDGELKRAAALAGEATALAEASGQAKMTLVCRNMYGIVLCVQGRFEEGLSEFHRAVEDARRLGYRDMEGQVLGNLAYAHLERGQADDALPYAEDGLQRVQEAGGRRFEAWAVFQLGRISHSRGDFPSARNHFQVALTQARHIGEGRLIMLVLIHQADLDLDLGRLEAVAGAAETLRQAARDTNWRNFEAEVGCRVARAHLELGALDEARRQAAAALAVALEAGEPIVKAMARSLVGRVALEGGDLDAADETLSESLEAARGCSATRLEGEILGSCAVLRQRQGRLDEAGALAAEGEARLREVTARFSLGVLLAQRAAIDAARGDRQAAAAALAEARELRDRLGTGPRSALAVCVAAAEAAVAP